RLRLWRSGRRAGPILDARHQVADRDRLAGLLHDAQHAAALGRQLHARLVALELEEHLVLLHGVAVGPGPARDLRLGDRLPHARYATLEHVSSPARRYRRAKARFTRSASSA